MAKINLLPWRADRRERRKREFFSRLGLAAVVAILLVLLWWLWMNARIAHQESNNNYLRDQIKQQQAKIVEIDNLQKVKDRLLARKKIIEKLQSSRSQMVHLFDEIVKTIPSGARLTSLKEVENGDTDTLTLDGVAQSNSTVAEYMKNIQASPWMGPAKLVQTQNTHGDANTPYTFELVVTLGTPKSSADADGGQPAPAGSTTAPAAAVSTAAAPAVALPTSSAPASLPNVGAPAASAPAALPGTSTAVEPAPLPSAAKPSPAHAAVNAAPHAAAPSHNGGAKS